MSRNAIGDAVMRLCGAVLLAAVALKVHGLSAGGVGRALSLLSPRTQLVGTEVEALVGIWLLSGYARRGAWWSGLMLFFALAAVSAYLVAVGQKSCGCFGRVEVSPWVSLALDAVCALGLVATRPDGVWPGRAVSKHDLVPACGLVAAVGLLFAATGETTGRSLSRLRGEPLFIAGGDTDAGAAPKGESRTVPVTVENLSETDVNLFGGTTTCACVATADLPLIVPAHGQATVHVTIKFTGEMGRSVLSAKL
ncbi:MauE/DoxX family redox-associated membrane protein [Frigoriglobus tundricola]|uniref:Methylamine utilisation protein MauE domain-containing protein n=1 Tax=Frigoriglobus tundricola TaxID=2774151 RepID=A0A6M5YXR8_9BACT|nr:MauE/DoxX family redox-associated membrane protein [Frigoriglobus tundricola]QJW98785.1 hypothetical protein FTUN_6380 [Frigoriglobus tundricola]